MINTEHSREDGRDQRWMRVALAQARAAAFNLEVPVGAVVVCGDHIVGSGANAPIQSNDPTAHAEIVALRDAARHIGNYRLEDCELFVTLEPCVMCAGAMLHARLKRVVFGAPDPKTGSVGSVVNIFAMGALNHQTELAGGVLQTECAQLLRDFFSVQRRRRATEKRQAGRALRDDALRTPENRFAALTDLPGSAHYVHDLPALNGLRLHYLDNCPEDAMTACVYLHGCSDWCYAWRAQFTQAKALGQRAVCLDLIGFGKSDKPKKAAMHSLPWHAQYIAQLFDRLGLKHVCLIAPQEMQVLVHHVVSVVGARVTDVVYEQPEVLPPEALDAPFPDDGHRAALHAFSTTVWIS